MDAGIVKQGFVIKAVFGGTVHHKSVAVFTRWIETSGGGRPDGNYVVEVSPGRLPLPPDGAVCAVWRKRCGRLLDVRGQWRPDHPY